MKCSEHTEILHAVLHLDYIYEHSDPTQLRIMVAAAVAFQLVIVRVIVATAWLSYKRDGDRVGGSECSHNNDAVHDMMLSGGYVCSEGNHTTLNGRKQVWFTKC